MRRTYAHNWQELVERGVARGEFTVSNARLASYAILEMGVGVALWFRPDGELSETEVAETYADMAIRLLSGTTEVKS
jgi:hypothetical protein